MIRPASSFAALVLAALTAALPASAQTRPVETARPPATEAPPTPPPRPSSLDDLFARLAAAKDEDEAKGVASLIERRLGRSGSDTADLLLDRSGEALKGNDPALAVELLDRVTQIKPDWAEAWNRRAAAFHSLDDPGQAIQDLQQALTREPRHYGAWMALGYLELAGGNNRRALLAFRHALKIHPHLPDAGKMVERLAPDVDGRDL